MKWGITLYENGVRKVYENSGEGLEELMKELKGVLSLCAHSNYISIQIDYEER